MLLQLQALRPGDQLLDEFGHAGFRHPVVVAQRFVAAQILQIPHPFRHRLAGEQRRIIPARRLGGSAGGRPQTEQRLHFPGVHRRADGRGTDGLLFVRQSGFDPVINAFQLVAIGLQGAQQLAETLLAGAVDQVAGDLLRGQSPLFDFLFRVVADVVMAHALDHLLA
jgi:hypothetical protein